ncbi:MAG TPA: dNTP triphosphohydrolase, partial [bacterium]|nr:dNTP triphosphohydrolase [bacterium]
MQFLLKDRKYYEQIEETVLAPYATKTVGANDTRVYPEVEHAYRTAFQRDRDRVVHSRAFRRLKHKQQVFLISEGDHYRTRLTHTLEVAQLSRTMARALGLNETMVEAIALAHDLGHTPFGHVGEIVLNQILTGTDDLNGLLNKKNIGGFKHNYQSLRVLDKIEKKYEFDGLNLTAPVREGVLKHTRLLKGQYQYPDLYYDGLYFDTDNATTLEGQVVAICDEIAQRTHDLEDGIRAGLVELEHVRENKIIVSVEKKFNIAHLLPVDRYKY